jgi:hypothetical protein
MSFLNFTFIIFDPFSAIEVGDDVAVHGFESTAAVSDLFHNELVNFVEFGLWEIGSYPEFLIVILRFVIESSLGIKL